MSNSKGSVGRRGFLKGAAAGAAGFAAAPIGGAQPVEQSATGEARGVVEITGNEKPGSDFMVDVLKTLGIEYCAANPGSSFRGLQESCINYGGNKNPEWLTCCHEESAAAMAHGYAKIEGKPMMTMVHGNVGLQHASMAIFNKGYGLYAEGPITDPKNLAPAIRRAIERVKAGEPALLDVVTQPR